MAASSRLGINRSLSLQKVDNEHGQAIISATVTNHGRSERHGHDVALCD